MKRAYFGLIFLLFSLSSCIEFEQVEVKSIGKITLETFEGTVADVNVDVELENVNFFGIKIKPSTLDVYVDEDYVGKAILKEKVKIKRKSTQLYNAKIKLEGESGILRKVMKYALRKDLKIRIKGYVKGSVYGIPKKVFVDETKTIDGRALKMKIPFLN
jgi:LEA14-like dessication related protein